MFMKNIPFSGNEIIKAKAITKKVKQGNEDLIIINDISLSIKRGERVSIVGVSGSGKTTLLGLLAGIDLPSKGDIFLGGEKLTALSENNRAKLRAGNVGFIFQDFQLLPNLTAMENVMLPLELIREEKAKEKAEDILREVGLENRKNHYPSQLSGGEQQRVSIARAFVIKPKVLFADEPTGNLDQKTGNKIIELLFKLNGNFNTTFVVVTHEKYLAENCERKLRLDNGKIVD